MRALITGAAGFAGSHLAEHLLSCGDEVFAADLHPQKDALPGAVALDVTDRPACERVFKEYQPEVIYHLAGLAFAPEAEQDFGRALAVNVLGTYNVLRVCGELHARATVVVVSSSEVYGKIRPGDLPVNEDLAVAPPHNYSLSKAMCELAALRFQKGEPRAPSVVVRAFNHIGPRQRDDFVVSSFAHQLARMAVGRAEPVIKVGNLEAERDFSDVRDIVRGYRLAALKGEGIYNLCSGVAVSVRKILETMIDVSGLTVRIEPDPARMRPAEVPVLYGSNEKARRELGWEPRWRLEDSLRDVYEYWLGVEKGG